MKPESRLSSLNRSFRKSFRRKKPEESEKPAVDPVEAEKKLLDEFKKALVDVLEPCHDDCTLRRFLKAKDDDLKEAEKLFRLDVNYRKFLRVEDILADVKLPKVGQEFFITGKIGYDKEGSLVRIVNIGQCDLKGLIHSLSTIEFFKANLWFLIKDGKAMQEENKKTGRNSYQYTFIVNMENMNASHFMYKPVLDTALCSLKLLQDHFYDIIKAAYVVNAPAIFSSIYKLLKPVIQDELNKRIKIYSSSDNWKEVLLQNIDASVLPVHFGGTRVDRNGDPRCSEFIGQGGTIDEMYYTTKEQFLDPEGPGVHTAIIPAGSYVNVPLEIQEAGTLIRWHLCGKDNDIGISVFYEPPALAYEEGKKSKHKKKDKDTVKEIDMSKLEPLTPVIRSQCHISPEVCYCYTWKPGVHIFQFDNTYSWRNPKEVIYKIETLPPNHKISPDEELAVSLKRIHLISKTA